MNAHLESDETSKSAADDRQMEIDEDACLALTGDATQCGNGIDTDASDPNAGLCGVHVGSDAVRVVDFENPAYVGLRDDFVEIFRSETEAYALATISPEVGDIWNVLTGLEDVTVGPVEFTAAQACGRARDLAKHPDLNIDDHPLVVGGCIALQGKSAKNHSCPNNGYGTTLLCGMHKDADLRGTVLDDDEPGPDLDEITVDGREYQLVEQRGDDLIVVDPDKWELRRLAGAETRWNDLETTPDLSDDAETIVLVGCVDAKADEPRKAKNLYTSNWSTLKRRYAEEFGDEWAILSAKYGLLDPEAEIDPYDVSMDDVDVDEWEISVLADLPDVRNTEIVVLAGPDYVDVLEGDLFMYGAEVSVPGEGKKIGERMSWLSEQLDESAQDGAGDEADGTETANFRCMDCDNVIEDSPMMLDTCIQCGGTLERVHGPVAPPQTPEGIPKYIREGLQKQNADNLRTIAAYAEELADYQEAEVDRELEDDADQDTDETPDEWDEDEWTDVLEDALEKAEISASKGTLTEKEIDGRDYYYLQWREGDKIKSQYVAPVSPSSKD